MISKSGENFNLNEIYQFISHIVNRCGKVITDAYYEDKNLMEKEVFSDFVTDTDRLVEKILIKSIQMKYPTHKFFGEESVTSKLSLNDDPIWIIDPIDGTINFVHRYPNFALSIALFIDKEPHLAIVYNPITNELYSAIKGQGAFYNGRPINSSQETELNSSQIITEFGYVRKDNNDVDIKMANMRNLIDKVHNIRCLGAASLSCCLVAQGCFDLYYEYGIHIWDIAAGVLIAKEANCHIFDPVTGREDLNLLNRRLMISSSKELAKQVIPLIKHVYYDSD